MYIPKPFEVCDKEEIFSFIDRHAFGQLISNVNGRLQSTHLPVLLSADKETLLVHLAKQNPQHLTIENQEVLITFQGAHDYISPSWYSSSGVPTWNYEAVHVYGKCKLFTNKEQLKCLLSQLTEKYEARFENPWSASYQSSMLEGIVGIEIAISEVQCKYKLSQNRDTKDQLQVIAALENIGSNELANAMKALEN